MKDLIELFTFVQRIKDENKKNEEFNVYDAIGFNTQEVIHSKLIAFLLNPRSAHKFGSQFLKSFLSQLGLIDFRVDNVCVSTEKRAGKRRIDIVIENDDSILIIENKIWHNDSPCQLEDYYKYCKKSKGNVEVMYLTPYGHRPSAESLGDTLKIEDVKCISYENDIILWIEKCSKHSKGSLKYSLEMYSELLQTVINRSRYMNLIFEELKSDREKLRLALDIRNSFENRNFVKEFPEIKEVLLQSIYYVGDYDVNPYFEPDEDDPITAERLTIDFPEDNMGTWTIYFFDESQVHITNDDKSNYKSLPLFYSNDLSSKFLQSLIIGDNESVNKMLAEKFEEIRQFCKSKWI